jgi:hypothetical protein
MPPADVSAVASGSIPVKRTRKCGRRDNLTVTYNSDGQSEWDISSEEYSYSDSGSLPRKPRKHGRRDKITLLKDGEGNDVIDISEEEFSYSESE